LFGLSSTNIEQISNFPQVHELNLRKLNGKCPILFWNAQEPKQQHINTLRMPLNAHVQNPKADFCAFIGIRVRAGSMQVKMFVAIRAQDDLLAKYKGSIR